VDRLVVDETAHRVTHIVVDGRLVGVRRLRGSTPDQLVTDLDPDTLRTLPELHHAGAAGNILSLVASCKLHHLDPELYLTDIIRIVPYWPRDRYLELAPDWMNRWPSDLQRLVRRPSRRLQPRDRSRGVSRAASAPVGGR